MRLVIVESPFRGASLSERTANITYAQQACLDCVARGEAPYASHLLCPQFLNEDDSLDREMGIAIGFAWGNLASVHVFYTDRGWSKGMLLALTRCTEKRYDVEFRSLGGKVQLPPQPNDSPVEHSK